jgi:hypothetical protein
MPRRTAVVEGPSIPRYPAHARTGLAPSDRWVLLAAVVGGSAVSAIVASALTVRIMMGRGGAQPTASTPATGGEVITPVKDSALTSERADTVIAPPRQPVRPPVGDQRTLALGTAGSAPPASASRKTTNPPRGTALLHRPSPQSIAPAAAAPSATVFSTAPVAPPAPSKDSAVSTPAPQADTAAATVVPVAVPVVAPAPPPEAPPVAAPAAPPAAAAAAAAPQTDIAAELKAIRDELNARKKRVDSLTHSLDSLKTPPPPR